MKRQIIIKLFAVLIGFIPLVSLAQFDNLKTQLEGKKTLSEIGATVEKYMATIPDSYEKEKFQKHFARWAYYQSLHLGPKGEFVNVAKRTFEAVQNKITMPSDRSANSEWTFVGPNSVALGNPQAKGLGLGRADRIAFHPTNPNIFYVGTPAGGLWKTTNGGSNWTAISNFIPSLGISGIVVDQFDPNTIYVLTGDGDGSSLNSLVVKAGYHRNSVGVLITHDGGINWNQTGELFNGDYVGYRLVQHPNNPNLLLAATSEGIYRTLDGGDTWSLEKTGKYFDIEFKPGFPSRVYASGEGEFIYSTNTGDTWNSDANFDFPLCSGHRIELAVTPDLSNKVYLLAGPANESNNTFCGFFVSDNSGLDFTRLCNYPNILGDENGDMDQSDYDMGLAVSPTNSNTVIAAGLTTYKSINGGSDFINKTTYWESGGNYIHPDIHAVEYNPLNGNLYALGDGGIYLSTDDGETYTDIYTGLNTAQFYGLDKYDANQYALLGGCQDNGVKYKTINSTAFDQVRSGDGADAIINYSDVTKGYAVVNMRVYMYSNFTTIAPELLYESPGFFPQIEMNTSNPNIIYVGYSRIRKYDLNVFQGYLGDYIEGWWALKTCPSNSTKIYAAGGESFSDPSGDMFVSSNGGDKWILISNSGGGFPAVYNRISDIGVESDNSNHVWVTFSGYTNNTKVYYSSNSGSNWINKSYDLPNIPIWTIAVDADNNTYVGTDYGVFYLASDASSWEPFYNNLPNVPVSELALNESAGVLHAATFGRGIWKTTVKSPCTETLIFINDLEGQQFRSASGTITVYSNVIGGEGTKISLRAGNYIDLKPGFQANGEPGNKFQACTGACGSGMPPDFSFGNPSDTNSVHADINYTMNRNLGTLEINDISSGVKKVIVRLFNDKMSEVKVFLTDENGKFIKDIAKFKGAKGKTEYTFQTDGLKSGMYYLYLGIDKDVNHLQELFIPSGSKNNNFPLREKCK